MKVRARAAMLILLMAGLSGCAPGVRQESARVPEQGNREDLALALSVAPGPSTTDELLSQLAAPGVSLEACTRYASLSKAR